MKFGQVFKGWLENDGQSEEGSVMVLAVKKIELRELARISGVAGNSSQLAMEEYIVVKFMCFEFL